MENPVLIFGAGGLGRAALEIFESHGVIVYGFLDDDKALHGQEIDDVSILGSTSDDGFLKLIGKKCEAFVASDDNKVKKSLAKMLNERRKVMPVNGVHQSASLARSVQMGHGNFVNGGATVGAGVTMGNHCVLHSGTSIDHGVQMGDFVQVGAGATVSANVTLEDEVFVGAGSTIISGVTLEKGARIGAGSVVISDVTKGKTFYGNPAVEVNQ